MDANPTTTTDCAKASPPMVDLQPNITVEQAGRMEAALRRRQRCDEDIARIVRDMLTNSHRTIAGGITLEREVYEELKELSAERAVADRDFTAAVFERRPAQIGGAK